MEVPFKNERILLFGFVEDEDEEIQPKEKERREITVKKVAKRCLMKTIIFNLLYLMKVMSC